RRGLLNRVHRLGAARCDRDVHRHVAQVPAHELRGAGVVVDHEQPSALHRGYYIFSNASLGTQPSMPLARRMRSQPPSSKRRRAWWPAWSLGPSRLLSLGASRMTISSATTTPEWALF